MCALTHRKEKMGLTQPATYYFNYLMFVKEYKI